VTCYIYTDIALKFRGSNGQTRQVVVPLQTHKVKSVVGKGTCNFGARHLVLGQQDGAATVVEPQRTGVSRMQVRRPVCSVAQ
jgi:hypothetical protein